MSLTLATHAFAHGEFIPDKYTCNGDNISPPLEWSDVPHAAKELVLIVDDPDAPSGTFVHWVVYHISPSESTLKEATGGGVGLPKGAMEGLNGSRKSGYMGPCPPSGTHRYYFHLYAVDSVLQLPPGATRDKVDEALRGHILETAELMGRYAKK